MAQFDFGTGKSPVNGALVKWRENATWRHYRNEYVGLTRAQVALRLGIPVEEYIAIENLERYPASNSHVAKRLANMVGTTVAELFPVAIKLFAERVVDTEVEFITASDAQDDEELAGKVSIALEVGNDGSYLEQYAR